MRTPRWPWLLAGLLLTTLTPPARPATPRHSEDATLRAVQFLDAREGWAVGDEGVVWHTLDGGQNWEEQPSGVRASLRSVCFLNATLGWAAGREELTGGGSAGVLLVTTDGGWTWKRILAGALPGLHVVKFLNEQIGYAAGEGTDQFPSGLFQTLDGGRTWQPVAGSQTTGWQAADFDTQGGVLGGSWNRLAALRKGAISAVDMDTLGGRGLRGVQLRGEGGVAVGQGGLVLLSTTRGSTWHYADLKLPPGVRSAWDLHAVGGVASHIWAVGRPGSAALHSPDGGKSWEVVKTGQPLPLYGISFKDEKNGCAVGALGTVVTTSDGGKTWAVRRRGGQKAGVLFVHARPTGAPLEAVARLAGQDGYLAVGLSVTAPDGGSAAVARGAEADRFAASFRQAGGAHAGGLWSFPVPSHIARTGREMTLGHWNRLHAGQAGEQMLAQIVQEVRAWRPAVVITDADLRGDRPGAPTDALGGMVAEAVLLACEKGADPAVCPDHLSVLGLEPHRPLKVYGLSAGGPGATITLDATAVLPALGTTARDFAEWPHAILAGAGATLPAERTFKLALASVEGASGHRDLMQGTELAPGGFARRALAPAAELSEEATKTVRQRATLRALAEAPGGKFVEPDRMLSQIGPMLADMPDEQAAPTCFALAQQYARLGQWSLAREVFLLTVDRYPAHPLSADALRWLIAHNASGEARRRHELGQFLIVSKFSFGLEKKEPAPPDDATKKGPRGTKSETRGTADVSILSGTEDVRRWHQGSLDLEPRLLGFGARAAGDPATQFCLQAARRALGDVAGAREWYAKFASRQPDGPWRSAALAELWLLDRTGPAPKPTLACRATEARPFLDGKLEDECWQGAPTRLVTSGGEPLARYTTEVRTRHDKEFLYVAVTCNHPAGAGVPAAARKTRDADLRGCDRVSVLLDVDRDYATAFHFQVDASGRIADDCWGDRTWDPRWFVAVHREPTCWTAEMAIPLTALSGDRVTVGRAWAANVVRTVPGQGVQAVSLPAEAPDEALRPEGLGLLIFTGEPSQAASH